MQDSSKHCAYHPRILKPNEVGFGGQLPLTSFEYNDEVVPRSIAPWLKSWALFYFRLRMNRSLKDIFMESDENLIICRSLAHHLKEEMNYEMV